MVGIIARDENNETEEYKTSAIHGKINLDMEAIKTEEQNYVELPVYYSFRDESENDNKNKVLMSNFLRINREVELIVKEFGNSATSN